MTRTDLSSLCQQTAVQLRTVVPDTPEGSGTLTRIIERLKHPDQSHDCSFYLAVAMQTGRISREPNCARAEQVNPASSETDQTTASSPP